MACRYLDCHRPHCEVHEFAVYVVVALCLAAKADFGGFVVGDRSQILVSESVNGGAVRCCCCIDRIRLCWVHCGAALNFALCEFAVYAVGLLLGDSMNTDLDRCCCCIHRIRGDRVQLLVSVLCCILRIAHSDRSSIAADIVLRSEVISTSRCGSIDTICGDHLYATVVGVILYHGDEIDHVHYNGDDIDHVHYNGDGHLYAAVVGVFHYHSDDEVVHSNDIDHVHCHIRHMIVGCGGRLYATVVGMVHHHGDDEMVHSNDIDHVHYHGDGRM